MSEKDMRTNKTCSAVQKSDMMICKECHSQWDVNDADRPACKPSANLSEGLESLGNSAVTNYAYDKPDAKLLEKFPNPFDSPALNPYSVSGELHIEIPEFTSLCPKTGQPDFAKIIIDYKPGQHCVESKSLKLYLGSFRNHGEFHESCINRICNDLVELLDPDHIQVRGEFTPRGGIPFWPIATWVRGENGQLPTTELEQAG